MERAILHIDCNKFYASVECLHRPEIRDKPVAVGGSTEERRGIILTKNEIAARFGVATGEALWQARRKCPQLVIVPPNFPLYMRFSKMARAIYADYSRQIEPFGLDECWIDVTGAQKSPAAVAQEIRRRVKYELGITVSVGVSWNKIFAKFGSDYKKPDAVTVINRSNYKDIVWKSPCADLLFVGPATARKLSSYGIYTIGELARADISLLRAVFGKNGEVLHTFANGLDSTPVCDMDAQQDIKSIGNSTTTPRDMHSFDDVKTVMTVLAESVARRLREHGVKGRGVSIFVRDCELHSFTRQARMPRYTDVSSEITAAALELFRENWDWSRPLRGVGVSVFDFGTEYLQFDLSGSAQRHEKLERVERAVDDIRRRFGSYAIQRASLLAKTDLSRFDPHEDHIIHPVGYFKEYKGA